MSKSVQRDVLPTDDYGRKAAPWRVHRVQIALLSDDAKDCDHFVRTDEPMRIVTSRQ